MNYILYVRDFFLCFLGLVFYGMFMIVPRNSLIASSLTGSIAYLTYRVIFLETEHELVAYLVASLIVAVFSEILARRLKMPATIFVLPGIIPLVPGIGLYKTMLCLVQNDIQGSLQTGVRAVFIGGIITVAIAIINSLARHITKKSQPMHISSQSREQTLFTYLKSR